MIKLIVVLFILGACARVEVDSRYADVRFIGENDTGTAIALLEYSRVKGEESPVLYNGVFYLEEKKFVQQPVDAGIDHAFIVRETEFVFSTRGDHLVFEFQGETHEVPVLHIPLRAAPGSEHRVARYYGRQPHHLQIVGEFPGGVMMRDPERLMLSRDRFADSWFPITPDGIVGAELVSPFPDWENRALYLSTTGIGVFTAISGSRQRLWFADANTGEVLLVVSD